MVTIIHFSQWVGGLGQENGDDDGQHGCKKNG